MRRAVALVLLVELAAFGLFVRGAGFFHDDWMFVEIAARSRGFWDAARAVSREISWSRPVEMLTFPLFLTVGGSDPVFYRCLLVLLEAVQGCLLFLLLDGLVGERSLAAVAAVFFLVYPNHAATHVWFSNSPQSVALAAALGSLVAHERWLGSRRAAWLAAGQAAYLFGALCYESTLFLPLILWSARAARKRLDGARPFAAAAAAARELGPYLLAACAVVAWQRLAAPALSGKAPAKGAALSPIHAALVLKAALASMTYQTLRLCGRTALPALRDLPAALLLGLVAASAAAAAALTAERTPDETAERRSVGIAAAAAAGGFLAAALPYALSKDYTPTYVGTMSRTSALLALPGGLLLAAGLTSVRRSTSRRAAAALMAALLCAFTWCDWHTQVQWALSWRLQKDVLRMAAPKAASLPRGAFVLLAGAPRYINTSINEVVVFDASWDIGPALRLASRRPDLSANVVSPRSRFLASGYCEQTPDGGCPSPLRYSNLYLYRYDRDSLVALTGPPSTPVSPRDF